MARKSEFESIQTEKREERAMERIARTRRNKKGEQKQTRTSPPAPTGEHFDLEITGAELDELSPRKSVTPTEARLDLEITDKDLDEFGPKKTVTPPKETEKNPFEGQLDYLPQRGELLDDAEFNMEGVEIPEAKDFPDVANILSPGAEQNFDLEITEKDLEDGARMPQRHEPILFTGTPESQTKQKEAWRLTATERFETEFGIHPMDAEQIKGYAELSEGQKLLALENLRQLTLGRIQEESSKKYKKETAESKFLGRIWRGISKKYQIAKAEKTTAEEIKAGGIKTHGEILRQLVTGMSENLQSLEVIDEDGKAKINYIPQAQIESQEPQTKEKLSQLNNAATKFSKIPYEWSLPTASKKEREQYREVSDAFLSAQSEAINTLGTNNPKSIQERILNTGYLVTMNQFFVSHPEVEEQLKKIEDPGIWKSVTANIATERGLYFSAGFATRTATVSMLGLAGIPIAASLMGGYLAKKRASEGLSEQEVSARKGGKKKTSDKKSTERDFISAEGSTAKIIGLVASVSSAKNTEEEYEIMRRIQDRIDFTERKINEGLVRFGNPETRVKNQIKLMAGIREARIYVGQSDLGDRAKKERLNKFLNFREEKVSKAQKKYLTQQVLKGAAIGAGFAAAGWLTRHFIGEWTGHNGSVAGTTHETETPTAKAVATGKIARETTTGKMPAETTDLAPKAQRIAGISTETKEAVAATNTNNIVEVKKGDTVWSIAEKQLAAHGKLKGLSETGRLRAIDELTHKIGADPEKFGISSGDVNKIKVGERLKISSLFEEKTGGTTKTIPHEEIAQTSPHKGPALSTEANEVETENKLQKILDTKRGEYKPIEPEEPPVLKPLEETNEQTITENIIAAQPSELAESQKELAAIAWQEKIGNSFGEPLANQYDAIKDMRMSEVVNTKFSFGRFFGIGLDPEKEKALGALREIYKKHPSSFEQVYHQNLTVEQFLRRQLPIGPIKETVSISQPTEQVAEHLAQKPPAAELAQKPEYDFDNVSASDFNKKIEEIFGHRDDIYVQTFKRETVGPILSEFNLVGDSWKPESQALGEKIKGIIDGLSETEKTEASTLSVDKFLKKYFDKL